MLAAFRDGQTSQIASASSRYLFMDAFGTGIAADEASRPQPISHFGQRSSKKIVRGIVRFPPNCAPLAGGY